MASKYPPVPAEVREKISERVALFQRDRDAIVRDHKEDQLCREFIDPLLAALGWDLENRGGAAPEYRPVVREPQLKSADGTKAPDYAFQSGRERRFFLETKAPSVNLQTDPAPAQQIRRYGWNAKLPVNLLSNFAQFAIYDCRSKPRPSDMPGTDLICSFAVEQLLDQLPFLYATFSPDGIRTGALDRYIKEHASTRQVKPVDDDFLDTLEDWRKSLANDINRNNAAIIGGDESLLNLAVQLTLDRLIFLRMAEDRRLESADNLLAICNGKNQYARFLEICTRADLAYNSGLFDFATDRLTRQIKISDRVIEPIIRSLYAASGGAYEFRFFPHDLLGSVYERFLGNVIRILPAGGVKIEKKPEIQKAGGVHYTPGYIVDYIVEHAVHVAIKDKNPKQIEFFRVLDPACGSGSFLLGAYGCLLSWYRDWYAAHQPEKNSKAVRKTPDGWVLTIAERKRILTSHIFGVDLDPQAVEVTKLSLLLKVLEDTDRESLVAQRGLFGRNERWLPNIDGNIKCGNSLIGWDFFAPKPTVSEEEKNLIAPFDWHQGFPTAMKSGGFDAVIGNPPYLNIGGCPVDC